MPVQEIHEWTDIVRNCINGSATDQRKLYEHFKKQMFVLCLRYADSHFEAEDILQEGFIIVFKDLHQFSSKGPLGAWIRKVILNAALKYVRKKKTELNIVELKDWDKKEEIKVVNDSQDKAGKVIKIMQQMPIGYRTILNLYFLEGYSHNEISSILGISTGTSKSQLKRGKAYLRKMMIGTSPMKNVAYGE